MLNNGENISSRILVRTLSLFRLGNTPQLHKEQIVQYLSSNVKNLVALGEKKNKKTNNFI